MMLLGDGVEAGCAGCNEGCLRQGLSMTNRRACRMVTAARSLPREWCRGHRRYGNPAALDMLFPCVHCQWSARAAGSPASAEARRERVNPVESRFMVVYPLWRQPDMNFICGECFGFRVSFMRGCAGHRDAGSLRAAALDHGTA